MWRESRRCVGGASALKPNRAVADRLLVHSRDLLASGADRLIGRGA